MLDPPACEPTQARARMWSAATFAASMQQREVRHGTTTTSPASGRDIRSLEPAVLAPRSLLRVDA
jgi:hypothetical protein